MKTLKSNTISVIAAGIMTAGIMVGCGGGGDDTPQTAPELTGVFIDAAVKGLDVDCDGLKSTTNSGGEFKYKAGNTCTFKMGEVTIGSAKGGKTLTPESVTENATQLTNVLRFLQTLDIDNNPSNGINLPTNYTGTLSNFETDFDAEFNTFLSNNSDSSPVVSAEDANAHFDETQNTLLAHNDSGVVGTWVLPGGQSAPAYNVMTVFLDNDYYLYAQGQSKGGVLGGLEFGKKGETALVDTNGGDTAGGATVFVYNENTPNAINTGGNNVFNRVITSDTTLAGSWIANYTETSGVITFTLLTLDGSGSYMLAAVDTSSSGIVTQGNGKRNMTEFGVYSANSENTTISFSATQTSDGSDRAGDNNGDDGFNASSNASMQLNGTNLTLNLSSGPTLEFKKIVQDAPTFR